MKVSSIEVFIAFCVPEFYFSKFDSTISTNMNSYIRAQLIHNQLLYLIKFNLFKENIVKKFNKNHINIINN